MPRGGSRPLDPMKAAIAKSVQDNASEIITIGQLQPDLEMSEVEVQSLNPTETIIRVKTPARGTRYFHIKVREMM